MHFTLLIVILLSVLRNDVFALIQEVAWADLFRLDCTDGSAHNTVHCYAVLTQYKKERARLVPLHYRTSSAAVLYKRFVGTTPRNSHHYLDLDSRTPTHTPQKAVSRCMMIVTFGYAIVQS